jgi:hypothetical protein
MSACSRIRAQKRFNSITASRSRTSTATSAENAVYRVLSG